MKSVTKRVQETIEKREVVYEEFFLKTYLVRILDLLIVIDNDRECVDEDEEFYPGDEEEYEISLCNSALVDLYKRSDERRQLIKECVKNICEE